jgi:uncharacterized protein
MRPNANYWIEKLKLTKHPEGGAFCEPYRSSLKIEKQNLPGSFQGDRNISTSIYFLLQRDEFSAFHRIASDELWHFYFGDPLTIFEIDTESGKLILHKLGSDFDNGETFQTTIKAGNWFASKTTKDYSLAGCTVAPGFDFADFELAERNKLINNYPQHGDLITLLTR